jgi:hypothetical protein
LPAMEQDARDFWRCIAAAFAEGGKVSSLQRGDDWIPVGERVPDTRSGVLAWRERPEGGGYVCLVHYGDGIWHNEMWVPCAPFSHWKPIPGPGSRPRTSTPR